MTDDWMLWIPFAIAVGVVAFVHWWVRAIARHEIRKELRGFVLGHAIQPRAADGKFKKR